MSQVSYRETLKDPSGERVRGPGCFTETIKEPRFHRNHQGAPCGWGRDITQPQILGTVYPPAAILRF